MPDLYQVPSAALGSVSISLTPQATHLESYVNLAAAATVDLDFSITFSPLFDIYVFMDQTGSLQPFVRTAITGSGSTFRAYGNPYVIAVSLIPTILIAIRLPGIAARWRLTNTGALTTVLEYQVFNRSL